MTPVQQLSDYSTTGSPSITLTITNPGDLIVVALGAIRSFAGGAFSLTSITNNGTALPVSQVIVPFVGTNNAETVYQGIGVYAIPAATGSNLIAAQLSASVNTYLFAAEFPLVGNWVADGSQRLIKLGNGTSVVSNSFTPSAPNDLLIGVGLGQGGGLTFSNWTNGFTQIATANSGPSVAWSFLSDTGETAITSGVTQSSSVYWAAAIAGLIQANLPYMPYALQSTLAQ